MANKRVKKALNDLLFSIAVAVISAIALIVLLIKNL